MWIAYKLPETDERQHIPAKCKSQSETRWKWSILRHMVTTNDSRIRRLAADEHLGKAE
jgi:hypothetical protein